MNEDLRNFLRAFVTDEAYGPFRDDAHSILGPRLPPEPLEERWLRETAAPLSNFARTRLWLALAYLGRKEIASLVREDALRGREEERWRSATALALISESEGLALLKQLHSTAKELPRDWITEDSLKSDLGTPAALALRKKLLG